MKTWKRGRHKATQEQKELAQKYQKDRVKITNIVARRPNIERKCCICGKEGTILHNKENPYYITFICKDCRKDENKRLEAENHRFNLLDIVNEKKLGIRNYSDEEIKKILDEYPKDMNMGDFCNKYNISRYLLNEMVTKYCELYPEKSATILEKIYGTPKIMKSV